MGIPKFFRWMSERYPMCSQLITENRIPEFDNLYLDMNGIIHNCSHNNNESAHFRITEEQIWIGIFNYVDHLFAKIKPKKTFFLAIDGVAPRAKMNQQRSRRFRTAKDAEDTRKRALIKGEELPEEDPFDSNCITPGTAFMKKLTLQLRYFISKKVSEDVLWRDVEIILSGPEVPGEGEHKIMEFIRLSKAQPGYNPNTRHCLYGLDADLVMLGLLSHDPHFALLREEVTFGGKKSRGKAVSLESQNFYLMHLSLLREYLDMEFKSLTTTLTFDYNLERILDDFILLALFVGNDFLPNLPNLHINEGALGLMFNIYKKVLPSCNDYIQDGGNVNMANMQLILDELAQTVEKDAFEAELVDSLYLGGKQQADFEEMHRLEKKNKKKKELVLTPTQRDIFDKIKEFVLAHKHGKSEALHFPSDLKPVDRKFVEKVADDLALESAIEYSNEDDTKHIYVEIESDDDQDDSDVGEIDEEALAARDRVLNKYDNATVVAELSNEEIEKEEKDKADQRFKEWRAMYYKDKMDIDIDNEEQMDGLIGAYITGIQWVLHYYYDGVVSWGWFYPYHYAPKISDLVNITKYQDTKFDLGQPFKPYEQLMGVLPALSKKLLPAAYQELMTDPSSPIIDFYPRDFDLDMNGKKQDWEAVIKIPFIDEKRLLEAMQRKEGQLTNMERDMARLGDSFKFVHETPKVVDGVDGIDSKNIYKSPLPQVFPDIHHCCAREVIYHLPTLGGEIVLRKSLLEGAKSGKDSLSGFPTLATIPHSSVLDFHNVKVFQQDSKNETVVVNLHNRFSNMATDEIAKLLLYKRVFVNYPYLQEAVVIAVSNETTKYTLKIAGKKRIVRELPLDPEGQKDWSKRSGRAEYLASKRFGLEIGPTSTALHVCVLRGMKRTDEGALIKEYVSPAQEELIPVQSAVMKVAHEDSRYIERKAPPVSVGYPLHSKIFLLGGGRYGNMGTITGHSQDNLDIQLVIPALPSRDIAEPTFGAEAHAHQDEISQYMSSFMLTERLDCNALTLSKITSSLQIMDRNGQRVNVGLNLKFEGRQQKVIGYTRKTATGHWEYSAKAADLIEAYVRAFPMFVKLVQGGRNAGFNGEMINASDLAWSENGSAEIKRMKQWLKERGVDDLPKAPLSAEEFEEPVIKAMETVAAQYHDYYENLDFKRVLIKNTPRAVLLRPEDAESKLHAQLFQLGDRVTYILESGAVPIDSKGTVVGVQEKAVEIVFDTPFMGGQDLAGRCSEYRGMVLPFYAVLNITVPQLAFESSQQDNNKENVPKQQQQQQHHHYHQKQSRGNNPDGQQQKHYRGNGGGQQQQQQQQQQPRRIMKKSNGTAEFRE